MADEYDKYLAAGGVPVPEVEFPATTEAVKKHKPRGPQVPTEPDPGGWRTAGIAASNALTVGFAPKIHSAGMATLEKVKGGELPWREYYDAYLNRDERMRLGAQQHRPGTYLATSMAAGAPYAAMTGGESLLGTVGGTAGLGAAQALGESKHFLGRREEASGKEAFDDALAGGAGGAVGGLVGYGIAGSPKPANYGGLPRGLLRSSDYLADKSIGKQTVANARKLSRVKPEDYEPGEWADMLLDSDIVGGWKSGKDVSNAANAASADLGRVWGDMPKRADASHPGVLISRVEAAINENADRFLSGIQPREGAISARDNFLDTLKMITVGKRLGRSLDEVRELRLDPDFEAKFQALKSPFMRVTHEDLQRAISESKLQAEASAAYAKPPAMRSDMQDWTTAIHKGARNAQDKGLEEALGKGAGEEAAQTRKLLAMTRTIGEVSGQRAEDIGGHEFLGLPGWAMLGGGGPLAAAAGATGHGLTAGVGAGLSALGTGLARVYRNELYNLGTSATNRLGHALDTPGGRLLLRLPSEEMALQVPSVVSGSNTTTDGPPREKKKKKRPLPPVQNQPSYDDSPDIEELLDQAGGR